MHAANLVGWIGRVLPGPGRTTAIALAGLLLAGAHGVVAAADDPSLSFEVSGKTVATFTLSQMLSRLPRHRVEYADPYYQKVKRLQAFALHDVLSLGFGDEWRSERFTEFLFRALDGYRSLSTRAQVSLDGGYIAFGDDERDDGWEPIGDRQVDPGPFYLFWTKPGQTTANEFPWPYQLVAIELLRFEDRYPRVYPTGAGEGSPALRGYETFKARCFRCHAMNRQGGKVGPDLNAPQSIVVYRSQHMIREFIRNPSKYRYTHMPDHEDLDDDALDELLAYFLHMSGVRR